MKDIKTNIASNLAFLRKKKGLTQAELAEKIGYSDKAISRWEKGDTLPDITMLYNLCEFYGISLDDLCGSEEPVTDETLPKEDKKKKKTAGLNYIIQCGIIVSLIWLVSISLFLAYFHKVPQGWMIFLWTVPISVAVMLFFLLKKEKHALFFSFGSTLLWMLLACIYLQALPEKNIWMIFLLGIPIEMLLVIIFIIKLKSSKNK